MERVREFLHHIHRLSEAICQRIREGVLEGAPFSLAFAEQMVVLTRAGVTNSYPLNWRVGYALKRSSIFQSGFNLRHLFP